MAETAETTAGPTTAGATTGETIVGIGTRKGLWLARSDDRRTWTVEGPHFLMSEVLSLLFDTRRATPRLLVGFRSSHWGPSLQHSDDLGATWVEHPDGSIRFPEDTETALNLPRGALDASWQCLRKTGNLSSASVLFVLEETMKHRRPEPGTWGILAAMGPGFCSELVLLRW